MLSGRYIHLIQALGLGPVWLKKGVRIKNTPEEEVPTISPATTTPISEIKEVKVETKVEKKVENKTEDLSEAIFLLSAYATTTHNQNNILWITSRPFMNIAAHDIEKSDYGNLLKQLIYAVSRQNTQWHEFLDANPVSGSLKIIQDKAINRIIILGKELANAMNWEDKINCPSLVLPSPAQMIRTPMLKKDVWEKLQQFMN